MAWGRGVKLVLLGAGLLATLLLAGLPSLGQGALDPAGEMTDARCYAHHKAQGFRSMDLIPEGLEEAPKGRPFGFTLTIRNPWLHELRELEAYVNVSDAPGVGFPGERPPVLGSAAGTLGASLQGAVAEASLEVDGQATEAVVRLVGESGPLDALPEPALANDFDLSVESPDGAIVVLGPDPDGAGPAPGGPATPLEEVRLNQTQLREGGAGAWKLRVSYRGAQPEARYALDTAVYYNLSRATEIVLRGPESLAPGESHAFTFTLLARDVEALQNLRVGGRGVAYYEHRPPSPGDAGPHDKWETVVFTTGAELRTAERQASPVELNLLSPIFRRWGQVLGFAGSFLILPSLVFGGTFGKGSVTMLNKLFGGPRTRVLFHNSMSFWLLGISLLHMLLFLYESFWNWSHGLVWGGLSLACMIGLGVTGATQRSFVAKWGFNRWRFVHFSMGVLVFVFVLVHLLADGTHFAPVREWLGAPPP